MSITNGQNALGASLLAVIAIALPAGQARAQCQGGQSQMRSLQRSGSQNSRLSTAPQQNSMLNALQQQQSAFLFNSQQAQQLAMLQARQLQQNALIASAPQPITQPAPAQGRRQRRDSTGGEIVVKTSLFDSAARDPEDSTQVAERRLKWARDLANDAIQAELNGERKSATRLRARADERLQGIIDQFPGSFAADSAKNLQQNLNDR
jgi:hypothetical protein